MITDDQDEVTAFLSDPASYGLAGPVETMQTHISRIFLVGDRAFKMKRAVKLPYVDFSTAELRVAACEKEVRLNAPGAPGLYLGVRRIVRQADATLGFAADGQVVEGVVEMARFDQSQLADRMALDGRLTPQLMTDTARMIARFHETAPVVHAGGGADNIDGVLSINEAGFATSHVFAEADVRALAGRFRDALGRWTERLDRREAAGKVRRCHGDLHLRNICVIGGRPMLFDCIEFNDQIATVDTLYDLAFLLMDLWHRGFRQYANLVANRYLDQADDEDGFVLLPFFMAVRAAVRAHVTATQAEEGSGNADTLIADARSYFGRAGQLLAEGRPRLIAIGGLSGSGKTTLADALAPAVGLAPGARVVESDRIRKRMYRAAPETKLEPAAYRPEVSEKVYEAMAGHARAILEDGGCVVADAVFDKPANRALVEEVARSAGTPFSGIWLETAPDLLRKRVASRTSGPSDADLSVLGMQLERKLDAVGWRKLDAARPVESLINDILE